MDVEETQVVRSKMQAGWHVSATSVCGSSHEKRGIPCQDAYYWATHKQNMLIAAVADGAGSAKHSDIGAQLAAQTAVETLLSVPHLELCDTTYQTVLSNALKEALGAVKKEAKAQGVKPRELASTLIVLMATPKSVAVAQIGDGAAVIQTAKGEQIALTTPDSGEYINQTTFLISPNALKNAQQHIFQGPITHVALFSDGLQMLALQMPFGKPHTPFFSPLFTFISKAGERAENELTSFLQSPRVRERTDDDLTLLLAALTDKTHATENQI